MYPSLESLLLLLLLLLPALATFFLFLNRKKGSGKQPPGPHGLPIIGNLHQFDSSCPHLSFYELSKTYGPLMFLRLGSIPTLVVSSAKHAKQVLKTHDDVFCSRPTLTTQQKLSYDGSDVAFASYGDHWREARKQCVLHLLSVKKVQSFTSIREEEVHRMITQKISGLAAKDRPVNLSEIMFNLSTTILCRVAFGRSYEDDNARRDPSFKAMLMNAQEMLISFSFSDYFPLMGHLVDKLTGKSAHLHQVFMDLDCFLEQVIQDHILNKTDDPQSVQQNNIVDMLLKLQTEESSLGFTANHIKGILMNVFLGGSETSASTVVWAMTELMKNRKVMKRLQEETRSLMMGNKDKDDDIIIKSEDVEKLVYLKAVVKETLRLHPIVPLLVPRQTIRNCTIDVDQGYEIQEKTLVFVSAWAIGRDPESWDNPQAFEPERFLNNDKAEGDSDLKGQDFEFIPFGSGRRVCPGMNMGLSTVELVLANLVCSYNWSLPVGMEEQDALDTRATETSAATVVWVMTELMMNPKAMKRVQEEARSLTGNKSGELIKGEHFENLKYLNAVIKETMRLHPIAPLLVPRETTRKCTIEGYEIQEKTLVYVNTFSIGRDPDSWENPEEFAPERFLKGDKAIDFRGQDFELTPFGSGRRICPGMQMGLAMVELTLVNLICQFDWELPQAMEEEVLNMSSLPGLVEHKKIPLCLLAKNVT